MSKKIIMPIALLTLVSLVVFVVAQIVDQDDITVSIHVVKGWNLVSNGIFAISPLVDDNSEIQKQDIVAVFYYSPQDKKYYQVYPNDENNILGSTKGYEIIEKDVPAAWVYSKKSGRLIFGTDDIVPVNERNVYAGWNLISLTPSLVENSENPDLTFGEIKGTCNVEKAYVFYRDWMEFDMPEMDSTLSGKGMAIKVSSDCHLGISEGEEISPPPALP
jgi:hypothetical protein